MKAGSVGGGELKKNCETIHIVDLLLKGKEIHEVLNNFIH